MVMFLVSRPFPPFISSSGRLPGGGERSTNAEITEQKPDERVAWRNDGKENAGGIKEKIGDALVAADRRVPETTRRGLIEPRRPTAGVLPRSAQIPAVEGSNSV